MSPTSQLRGVLVAFAAFAMGMLGFPGLDHLPPDWLHDEGRRAEAPLHERVSSTFQRRVRVPVVSVLSKLERPLRLAQSWSLYGVGPNRMVRFEVLVDGEVWYRAGDPDHTYQKSFLRYRRIRPVVVSTCLRRSRHSERLVQLLVDRVREEAPEARSVVVRCTSSPWPGTREPKVRVRFSAEAPSWTVRP